MKKKKALLSIVVLGLMTILPLAGFAEGRAIVWYEPVVEIIEHVVIVFD